LRAASTGQDTQDEQQANLHGPSARNNVQHVVVIGIRTVGDKPHMVMALACPASLFAAEQRGKATICCQA
jgi:hypothetical protein